MTEERLAELERLANADAIPELIAEVRATRGAIQHLAQRHGIDARLTYQQSLAALSNLLVRLRATDDINDRIARDRLIIPPARTV